MHITTDTSDLYFSLLAAGAGKIGSFKLQASYNLISAGQLDTVPAIAGRHLKKYCKTKENGKINSEREIEGEVHNQQQGQTDYLYRLIITDTDTDTDFQWPYYFFLIQFIFVKKADFRVFFLLFTASVQSTNHQSLEYLQNLSP